MKPLDYPEDFPTKDKKRGDRKAKFKQLKHNAADFARNIFQVPEEWVKNFSAKHAESLNCSCWMCKNPRRVFSGKKKQELTIQEQRQPTVAEFEKEIDKLDLE